MNRRWVDIHRRPMPLVGLDPALVGFKLVQLSDLHYSPVVWRRYLIQFVRWINELKPDLVVVTGDLITGGYRYATRVAQILAHIRARHGVICTLGNHDYGMNGNGKIRGKPGPRESAWSTAGDLSAEQRPFASRPRQRVPGTCRSGSKRALPGCNQFRTGVGKPSDDCRLGRRMDRRNLDADAGLCRRQTPRRRDDRLPEPQPGERPTSCCRTRGSGCSAATPTAGRWPPASHRPGGCIRNGTGTSRTGTIPLSGRHLVRQPRVELRPEGAGLVPAGGDGVPAGGRRPNAVRR